MLFNRMPQGNSGGGGFPDGWNEESTGEAVENITKGTAIVQQNYGSWDTAINSIPTIPDLPTYYGRDVSFSGDSSKLLISSPLTPTSGGGARLYNRKGENFTLDTNNTMFGDCQTADISVDGKYIATGRGQTITIYKEINGIFTKNFSYTYQADMAFSKVRFSPDSLHLAALYSNTRSDSYYSYMYFFKKNNEDNFILSDTNNLSMSVKGYDLEFSLDSNYIVVVTGSSKSIMFIKREGNKFSFDTTMLSDTSMGASISVCFSPNREYIIVGCDSPYTNSNFHILKFNGTKYIKMPNPSIMPTGRIYSAKYSNDGDFLALGSDSKGFTDETNKTLTFWKQEGDTIIKLLEPSLKPQGNKVYGLAFSKDGLLLACATEASPPYEICKVYRTQNKKVIKNTSKWGSSPLYWLPTGKLGIALETKKIGEQCKVNLFPILNPIAEST